MPAARRIFRVLAPAAALGALACGVASACSSREPYGTTPLPPAPDAGNQFDAGATSDGPPPLDAPGLCGNQLHAAITDAPNLYFVLDRSGSMAERVEGGTRYEAVRDAAIELVRKLGPLVNVGAAVFPKGDTDVDPCHAGGQVMAVVPGTPVDPQSGADGQTTKLFAAKTKGQPFGGTPTAATLEASMSDLVQLPGKTVVLLATDGGPNCNADAECDADGCMTNIEGQCPPEADNCCAPNGLVGPTMCVDEDATVAAIEELANAGVAVYVIGIPGSEVYSDVLDAMAIAGEAPQPGPPFYYRVDDLTLLADVFGSIAAVLVSCEFEIDGPPPEPGMTNVYLDGVVLPQDAVDGWTWKTDTVIQLNGEACARLKAGQIAQVQIVSGCPTEVAK